MTKIEGLISKQEFILTEARLGNIPDLNEMDEILNDFVLLDNASISEDDWVKFIKLRQYIYREYDGLINTQNKIEEIK